jgi:hypothetical protein
MEYFDYNAGADNFQLVLTPEEFETIHSWLRVAFNGISQRVHNGEAPLPAMEKLLALENTLGQLGELKYAREVGH